MKTKIILLFCIVAINSADVIAQFSYTGISIGYGTGLPAYSLGASTQTTAGGTTYTLEKGSYGQGLNFSIAGGYMFNKNIGAELGVSYLVGSKKEFTISTLYIDTSSGTITDTEGSITLDKISMIRVNSSIKITFGDDVRPYIRMGLAIGLGTGYTRTDENTIITSGSMNDTTVIEMATKYSGGASFGFNSAFGVDFDLTDNLRFFGELSFSSISWAPTKSTITEYLYNGVDLAATAPPGSLDTEYVDDYTQGPGNSPSGKALKTYHSFGTFGISAGVIFTFGEE
jgi:hypothetical protein